MEKIQKRIKSKKLLVVVPLCLILLVVTVVSKEDPETPEGFCKDGIWFDPLIPEIMVSPLNYSTPMNISALTSYPIYPAGLRDELGDGKITLYILMAYDDDFLSHSYETPNGILSAVDYARKRTFRAFEWFYVLYNVRFGICAEISWESNADTEEGMFYEAIEETGFERGKSYNGYRTEALIAWTTEFTYFGGLGSQELKTAMISYQAYWADDNIVQHELSHVWNATDGTLEAYLNGITDCYGEECIMSYKTEYVEVWFEDAEHAYPIYKELPMAYRTHIYCDQCMDTIEKYLWSYFWFDWITEWRCHGSDC